MSEPGPLPCDHRMTRSIQLVSSDGVIFRVDRGVLECASNLRVGNPLSADSKPMQDADTLSIDASAEVLKPLLSFLDPSAPSPNLEDVRLIDKLFRIAKEYEMRDVHRQLRQLLVHRAIVCDVLEWPLYVKQPLAVLVVAYNYGCEGEARLAVRECLKGSMEDHVLGAHGFDVPAHLISSLLKMRRERIENLKKKIDEIEWPTNECRHCTKGYGIWQLQVLEGMHVSFVLESVAERVKRELRCQEGHDILSQDVHARVTSWIAEEREREEAIPPLPVLDA